MFRRIYSSGWSFLIVALMLLLSTSALCAQTTSFTYQGRLTDGATSANGNYDLQFALFDSLAAGTQIGATQTVSNVSVSAGVFSVQLDFGASAFPGANRWLEISARLSGEAAFTTLSPRQRITSIPYAIRSLNASSADVVTVSGVPGGSGNYIPNNPPSQQAGNFNISGNGTAGGTLSGNIINTSTQYNLGGSRILSSGGTNNLFAGLGAGQANTVGVNNAFFGFNAGAANTGDPNDSNLGIENAFFGAAAGEANRAGRNSFFGSKAGQANTTGAGNAFFGYHAGILNNGGNNSFVGVLAGRSNLSGAQNSFFGEQAGDSNQTGNFNSFVGEVAGFSNTSGSRNTMIGSGADVGSTNLTNATAIGAKALVNQSDALVLGSIFGVNGATASVNVGIGTPTPQATLDVKGTGVFRPSGAVQEVSFGTPNGETGIVIKGPSNRADVRFNGSTLKLVAGVGSGPPSDANGLVVNTDGNVGIGTASPFLNTKLDIVGGFLRLDQLAGGGGETLCRNIAAHTITSCDSSSLRYKKSEQPLRQGLNLIQRLRPVMFTWKEDGRADLGLIAEEVAEAEPLLTFKNNKGEIEGVRYERLNVVLITAIKQQQDQIKTLMTANAALSTRLRTVERLVQKRKRVRQR